MTSIAFTGGIAFSKYFEKGHEKPDLLDGEIVDFLCSADYVAANIEAPVTAGEVQSGRRPNHVDPPKAVGKLLEINAPIWNLANNHVVDCKAESLRDTLAFAKKNGIQTFGASLNKGDAERILELPVSGGTGMFGITDYRDFLRAGTDTPGCITWNDVDTVRYSKRRNRWCVMVLHGGEVFFNLPLPYVRRRYLDCLEMGADVIIAQPPHVVQNYEKVGEKMIFHALGNFIFDTDYQRKQTYSEYGVLVKWNFTEKASLGSIWLLAWTGKPTAPQSASRLPFLRITTAENTVACGLRVPSMSPEQPGRPYDHPFRASWLRCTGMAVG